MAYQNQGLAGNLRAGQQDPRSYGSEEVVGRLADKLGQLDKESGEVMHEISVLNKNIHLLQGALQSLANRIAPICYDGPQVAPGNDSLNPTKSGVTPVGRELVDVNGRLLQLHEAISTLERSVNL